MRIAPSIKGKGYERKGKMKMLSIIVPCYNESQVIPIFYDELTKVLTEINTVKYEIVFVNDGSKDDTLNIIKGIAEYDKAVKYISLSRNFGKESAIYAGLENSHGDYVVIMDADLQDPPALIPEMFNALENEGFDCVGSRRVTRKGEPPIRSFFARMFYKLINKVSDAEIVDGARDFQMMSRKVVNAILSMKEYNRFSKGIFGWIGFKKKWLEYENIERAAGETKWNFWKLFIYALQGIIAFSTAPLIFSSVLGILCCILAIILLFVIVIKTLIFGDPTAGWPSMVCIIVFFSGLQMLFIGILGQYLAKTYMETKKRPIYLIGETNLKNKE